VKQTFVAVALITATCTVVLAQNTQRSPASLGEKIQVRGTPTVMAHDWNPPHVNTAPKYCKPCAFYAGDFDPNNSKANALANENDLLVPDTFLWWPWWIRTHLIIIGLFQNSLDTVGSIDNPTPWGIRQHVSAGNGGELYASGVAHSTDIPTGRSGFGLTEYTHLVKFKPVKFGKGICYANVTPQCIKGSQCGSAQYFASDEEDDPKPLNHVGNKNILDDSFINSASLGYNYAPTWGSSGACNGLGCDMFSGGVLGTGK
jgi:hypothetical protein